MAAFRIFRRLSQLLDVGLTAPADGDTLAYNAADEVWENVEGGAGGGAPVDATYLVATAHGDLTAEVAVGATPGGELGGTWASPTVDATHSGSSHASVQAAAEATAAGALSTHEADTTSVHGVADTTALYRAGGTDVAVADGGTGASNAAGARANLDLEPGTDMPSQAAFDDHSARHENGGGDEISVAGLSGLLADGQTPLSHNHAGEDITSGTVADARIASTIARDSEVTAAVDAHVTDATAAHAATAIAFTPDGSISATTVQAAIVEVRDEAGAGGAPTTVDYLVGTATGDLSAEIVVGTSPGGELGGTWASPTVDATHSGSTHAAVQAAAEATAAAALSAHLSDATDAHDASAISILDAANDFAATDVEAALAELQSDHEADATGLSDHLADSSAAHAASAISFSPVGSIAATDVQAAIAEVASEAGVGGGSTVSVSQSAHGLAVGDVVRHNGTIYVEAQADSEANAEVVGIVSAVADANNFTLAPGGQVTGLSSLSAGSVYYLSPSSAGVLTLTEPTTSGHVSKPVLIASGTTAGYFVNFRGAVIGSAQRPIVGIGLARMVATRNLYL